MIPLGRRWLFSPRFPDPVEAAFRAQYLRAFRTQMQVLWYLATAAWFLEALADLVLFPSFAGRLQVIRLVGFVFLLATSVAISLPRVFDRALHAMTAGAGTGVGLCTVALFAAVPFSQSFIFYFTLVGVCVVTTIFIVTLHYEYSVLGSLVTIATFAVCVFWLTPAPFAYAAGMTAGLVGVTAMSLACTNVIERSARENFAQRRALEEQTAAIAEKAQQLEISEGNARDANLAKSVFLSNMSHELRTPLNAVLGFAQFLERETGLSPDGRNNLRIIRQSGEHLLELINDVLAISKIEAGRITLSEHTFDVHEMIRSIADMIRVRTQSKGLHFIVTVAPDVPRTVVGDDGKLRQVLINLLGNAVKFTDAGGIALRVGWNGSVVAFELEDTGHGIAAAEMGQLFEAFAQTESGRKSKEGTGLGLAISRSFVRLMGGDIRVRSEIGRGTMFIVEVPLRVAEGLAPETLPRRVRGLEPGQPACRLLVVDDTAENRLLLIKLLTTVGFEVREATNGREAIDVWQAWQPHLIWMDMRMPVMDGHEATRAIREQESGVGGLGSEDGRGETASPAPDPRPPTPCKIIALTASAFEHEREEILSHGVDDFVAKPFREETIFDKLAEHLGVRYLYEDVEEAGSAVATEDSEGVLTPARLLALPEGNIRELYGALACGDIEAAATAAAHIREHDARLGTALLSEIRTFRFDELLSLLERLEHTT